MDLQEVDLQEVDLQEVDLPPSRKLGGEEDLPK